MSSPPLQESIAEIPEADLVRRLLADTYWRDRFLNIHGIPDRANTYPEVMLEPLGAMGDIDILAVDPNAPHFATGIQVKRVKVAVEERNRCEFERNN